MIFDPMYFLFLAPGLALSLWASWRVKSNFNKYSKVRSSRGITGAEAAAELLCTASIDDVKIVRTAGKLSDHYNPINKTLALSESVYDSSSIGRHRGGHSRGRSRHPTRKALRSPLGALDVGPDRQHRFQHRLLRHVDWPVYGLHQYGAGGRRTFFNGTALPDRHATGGI